MRFALFGTDMESQELFNAARSAGHELVWCGDVQKDGQEIDLSAEALEHLWEDGGWPEDQAESWEALCDPDFCEVVLMGKGTRPSAVCTEQLAQLARQGIAVLTTFPLIDSVLSYYEIDMARSEGGAVLHHYNPLLEQRIILEPIIAWVQKGHPQLGAVEQIVWERPLERRTREQVLWHFARDVELLGQVAGRLDRLGALGSPNVAATYSGLSVQLLGSSQVPVHWSVGPKQQSEYPRLTLVCQQGRVTTELSTAGQSTLAEIFSDGTTNSTSHPVNPAATQVLERFVTAVQSGDSDSSTWSEALHAMELTDTIEISLRRGRMIDIHPQQLTEELAFKGTMSALGCGVLVVLVPLLLTAGWLAELLGFSVAEYWPHTLLVMLALFLLVQFVPKLLLDTNNADSKRPESCDPNKSM